MWRKIVFFELRHYGDLHITRNFVRHMMKNIPAGQYIYVLTSDRKVFADFPRLSFETYDATKHPFTVYSPWFVKDESLYVNTSCGANEMAFYQGTTVQTAHAIFSHYLREFCQYELPSDLIQFIPRIDFDHFQVRNVDDFMSRHRRRRKVMVVNGEVQSGQASNFSMVPLIKWLSNTFPMTLFFLANSMERCRRPIRFWQGNIFYCRNITEANSNDIVETSYFSRFCDTIIGRASGVYTLSIEQENVVRNPKRWICFSHTERDKDLGVIQMFPGLQERFLWSPDFGMESMTNLLLRSL